MRSTSTNRYAYGAPFSRTAIALCLRPSTVCLDAKKPPTGGDDGGAATPLASSSRDPSADDQGGSKSLVDRQIEAASQKGSRFGFMRRQEFDSHAWMMKNFSQAETLPSGLKVYNLPPAKKEGQDSFDVYRKTTSDYISPVDPNKITGVGLGAGFGSRPDKRLGWLRPKKEHLTPLPPEEEEKRIMDQIQRDGIQDVPEAKTPQERKEQIERMLKYMKSYEGTSLSSQDHFLLVDLDFEKDSLLFGNTREEFVQNVDKIKQVILQYNKWERTDNAYRYGTVFLKFACAWLLIDCVQTYQRFQVLRDSLGEFSEMTVEDINTLKEKRRIDNEMVKRELEANPPDFSPVVRTILDERSRLRKGAAAAAEAKAQAAQQAKEAQQPSPRADDGSNMLPETVQQLLKDGAADNKSESPKTATTGGALTSRELKATQHPMDTTFEQAARAKHEEESRRRDLEQYATEMVGDSATGNNKSTGRRVLGYVAGLFRSKRNNAIDGDATSRSSGGGGALDTLAEPLTAADFSQLSYAAAPTSIPTVRAIRRLLLPRSDDFTQVVREEMLEYKKLKDNATEYR